MQNKIYLDYAATTPTDKRVLDEMLPYFCEHFGNASSAHSLGHNAAVAVDSARRTVAAAINAESRAEILFTSGGSEANNWAIMCAGNNRGKVLVSAIEHPSVLSAAERRGYDIIPVTSDGEITEEALLSRLSGDIALVSVMLVNNEIGVIQNIKRLAEIAHNHGALFHTDAVQALGCMDIDVRELGVDLMTLSAHKVYGAKGAGCLYARGGADITPLISGGHQERSMRGGTTNVPAIVGFGKSVQLVKAEQLTEPQRLRELKERFITKIKWAVSGVNINGKQNGCVPTIANIRFEGIDGIKLAGKLDLAGVSVSVGAACSAGSVDRSHVLAAIGLSEVQAAGSVRFSFGRFTTTSEIDSTAEIVAAEVAKLRK